MPASYDVCCADLAQQGMDSRKACRACSVAFWHEAGMMPGAADRAGVDVAAGLAARALQVAATLSAVEDERQVVQLGLAQEIGEVVALADVAGTVAPPEPGCPTLMREVMVMTPGTYNGHEWTLADLQEIAAAYYPGEPPPIQLQHDMSPEKRHGFVRGLRVVGEELWALAEFIGTRAVEAVSGRLWTKTSAGLVVAPYQAMLELSVVDKPAVPDSAIQNQREEGITMSNPTTSGTAAAAPETPPAPAAPVTPAPQPATAALSDQAGSDLRATLEAQQARIAQLEAQQAEHAKLARQAQDNADYIELCQAGKTVADPAVKALELKVLGSLTAEQRPDYLALRKAMPNVWPVGRTLTADLSRDGASRQQEDEEAKRLSAAMAQSNPAPSNKLVSASK